MFDGVSTNGSSNLLIQLGDAGGVETTGYVSIGGSFTSSSQTATSSTSGFIVTVNNASDVFYGAVVLTLEDSTNNVWVAQGNLSETATTAAKNVSGRKATSAALDRVRLTTANGTDEFDAGAVNILYE